MNIADPLVIIGILIGFGLTFLILWLISKIIKNFEAMLLISIVFISPGVYIYFASDFLYLPIISLGAGIGNILGCLGFLVYLFKHPGEVIETKKTLTMFQTREKFQDSYVKFKGRDVGEFNRKKLVGGLRGYYVFSVLLIAMGYYNLTDEALGFFYLAIIVSSRTNIGSLLSKVNEEKLKGLTSKGDLLFVFAALYYLNVAFTSTAPEADIRLEVFYLYALSLLILGFYGISVFIFNYAPVLVYENSSDYLRGMRYILVDFVRTEKTRFVLLISVVGLLNVSFLSLLSLPISSEYIKTGVTDFTVILKELKDPLFLSLLGFLFAANTLYFSPFIGEYLDRRSITNIKKRGEEVPSYISSVEG